MADRPTPSDALSACLRLMNRATPHPDDRDLWHDTIRQASTILAQHSARSESRRSLWRGLAAWAGVFALVALAVGGLSHG